MTGIIDNTGGLDYTATWTADSNFTVDSEQYTAAGVNTSNGGTSYGPPPTPPMGNVPWVYNQPSIMLSMVLRW